MTTIAQRVLTQARLADLNSRRPGECANMQVLDDGIGDVERAAVDLDAGYTVVVSPTDAWRDRNTWDRGYDEVMRRYTETHYDRERSMVFADGSRINLRAMRSGRTRSWTVYADGRPQAAYVEGTGFRD